MSRCQPLSTSPSVMTSNPRFSCSSMISVAALVMSPLSFSSLLHLKADLGSKPPPIPVRSLRISSLKFPFSENQSGISKYPGWREI